MMRVLLIDDHALFRIGLQELLERRGIDVIGALGDCHEGIRQAELTRPDVVLLDMRMPGMNGIEVLEELRSRKLNMPIAMLTTSREESDVIDSLQSGAQGYLLKDMEPDGDNEYSGGTIWDPAADKVYKSKMKANGNQLEVDGCIAFICSGQNWTRVE